VSPTWEELTALGITEALDGGDIDVNGDCWEADADDANDDPMPPGQLYLTTADGSRTVLVQVTVAIVEGTPA
jgi:hypothetical protein